MKKFGTPMGAAPGSAKEKVGLAGVGTPPLPVAGAGLAGALGGLGVVAGLVGGFGAGLFVGGGAGCLEGRCPVPGPVGRGGGCGVVPVVVVVVGVGGGAVVLVVLLVLLVVLLVPVLVVVVVIGVGVDVVPELVGGHDSWTVLTGPGRVSDETGAPGGSVK